MPSDKNLIALKECYGRIERSSSKLNDLFRKRTKELFDAFLHELEEFDGQTNSLVIRDNKIYVTFFDEYYSEVTPGISQQILSRLQKDDKECAKILEFPSSIVPARLDDFVNELFDGEIEKIANVIERAVSYAKIRNATVGHGEYSTELDANIGEINKSISKKKLREQISGLKNKHKALLSIIESISSTISNDGVKFYSIHITKKPERLVKPKVTKPVRKITVKKQEKKTSALKKPIEKKPSAKKPVEKKPVTEMVVVKKLVTKKPVAKKPIVRKVAAKKLVAKKPVAKKPVTENSVTGKPVVKKTSVKKLVAKKPVSKKTATKKPVLKKTVAKKSVEKKSATKNPIIKISKTKTLPKSFIMNIYSELRKIVSQKTKKVKRKKGNRGIVVQ